MDLLAGSAERISAVSVAGAKVSRRICVSGSLYMIVRGQDFRGRFKSSLRNEIVFDGFWFVPLSTSLRISLRVSLCQLCLATERPRFALKNGSSKWGTRESAIHHQVHCPVNRDHQAKWTCLINAGQVKISLTFQKSASGKSPQKSAPLRLTDSKSLR